MKFETGAKIAAYLNRASCSLDAVTLILSLFFDHNFPDICPGQRLGDGQGPVGPGQNFVTTHYTKTSTWLWQSRRSSLKCTNRVSLIDRFILMDSNRNREKSESKKFDFEKCDENVFLCHFHKNGDSQRFCNKNKNCSPFRCQKRPKTIFQRDKNPHLVTLQTTWPSCGDQGFALQTRKNCDKNKNKNGDQ